jgi:hypothetical protein
MLYAVGYDERTRELEVVFNTGGIYRYLDVDKSDYEGLFQARSKGRYMQDNIIGVYEDYKVSGRGRR